MIQKLSRDLARRCGTGLDEVSLMSGVNQSLRGVLLGVLLTTASACNIFAGPSGAPVPHYDRTLFGSWADVDGDCQSTRHEQLANLSTGPITLSDDGCRVIRGRWLDPYTGMIFQNSSDLDIDHIVPLFWAWQRGAYAWSDSERTAFANDPANLFAVDDGTNRSKGAQGPLEWLPPNDDFHCEYVTRFWRIVRKYRLKLPFSELTMMDSQRALICDA